MAYNERKCPECRGTGKGRNVWGHIGHSLPCPDCDGHRFQIQCPKCEAWLPGPCLISRDAIKCECGEEIEPQ